MDLPRNCPLQQEIVPAPSWLRLSGQYDVVDIFFCDLIIKLYEVSKTITSVNLFWEPEFFSCQVWCLTSVNRQIVWVPSPHMKLTLIERLSCSKQTLNKQKNQAPPPKVLLWHTHTHIRCTYQRLSNAKQTLDKQRDWPSPPKILLWHMYISTTVGHQTNARQAERSSVTFQSFALSHKHIKDVPITFLESNVKQLEYD